MEHDPSFKQLIPYVVFQPLRRRRGGGRSSNTPAARGQGEGRLHRKRSVGIGGHISADDVGADGNGNPYREGMQRELEEEISIDTPVHVALRGHDQR